MRASVLSEQSTPLRVEELELAAPRAGEVLDSDLDLDRLD